MASPYRETEAMADGSDAIADWPLLNALVNTASGASWVSIHHGGGVGIGRSLHAGQVCIADGTDPQAILREAAARQAGTAFLDEYVEGDGRVVRRDEGGDVVSEGQAYGMLIAVAVEDETRFRAIWDWTKANMSRPDGLLSWRWADGQVTDANSASDADLDAARALVLAGRRFDAPELIDPGLAESPITVAADAANQQHYAVPPAFFTLVLGPHMKYSSAYWPRGVRSLGDAERAMLDLTAARAGLEDGQRVMDLGCGWGSLTLYAAQRFPRSRFTALSNSSARLATT